MPTNVQAIGTTVLLAREDKYRRLCEENGIEHLDVPPGKTLSGPAVTASQSALRKRLRKAGVV